MATKKKTENKGYLKLVLTILVATGSITGIIVYLNTLSINITPKSSTFKTCTSIDIAGKCLYWTTAGIEKLYINGEQLSGEVTQTNKEDNLVEITRTNKTWSDTYTFNGNTKDIESFPISHQIRVLGQKDKEFKYEVSSLKYVKKAHEISSGESFGLNMKVTFDSGYTSAKVTKSGVMTVIYKIPSDDWILNVRLYDPVTPMNISQKNITISFVIPSNEILIYNLELNRTA